MASARSVLDASITEADFQARVIELAELCGWKWFHARDMKRSPAGFPDLVLTKPHHPVWFVELKTERGKVSKQQQEWLDALLSADGVVVDVWRPSDWDWLERVLTERG